jgi:NADP-dependent 3-hydroxy acid dehydrogenase YdfG
VPLVTGAGSGIGAATARRLACEGAAVALVARRRDRLDQVVEDIKVAGGHAPAMDTDISELPGCEAGAPDRRNRHYRANGPVPVVADQAGVGADRGLADVQAGLRR